jgi:hypothetical protein
MNCSVFNNTAVIIKYYGCTRHCGTSQKVAGPIPDGDFEILRWVNASGHSMALESNLTEMGTRDFPGE